GVEPGVAPPALAAVAFGNLARRDITAARQDAGTSQRVGQMDLVVPAVPLGFDRGIDFGSHDEKAVRQPAHSAFSLRWNFRRDGMRLDAVVQGETEDAEVAVAGGGAGAVRRRVGTSAGYAAQGRLGAHDGALCREF